MSFMKCLESSLCDEVPLYIHCFSSQISQGSSTVNKTAFTATYPSFM